MVKRILIAFDVDHTLIDETIDTYVLKLLPDSGSLPPSVQNLYSIHEWNVYQREVFRYLHTSHVSKQQLLACIDEMPLVKGMRELLEFLVTFRMTTTKADSKGVPSESEVGKHAAADGVLHTEAAENGFSSAQQQHPVINGAGPHSVADGKINSPPVQFEIIILSDANLVSALLLCSLMHFLH